MDSELKEFWEKCGFTYFQTNSGWVWVCPDGETQVITLPLITLDNLFKYAVPLLRHLKHISFSYSSYYGYRSGIVIYRSGDEALDSGFYSGLYKDPAQALYKALQEVL